MADMSAEDRERMGRYGRGFYEKELATEVGGRRMRGILERILEAEK